MERYRAGEHEPVWRELQALGKRVRDPAILPEAREVARLAVQRAREAIQLLQARWQEHGYVFGYGFLEKSAEYHPPAREFIDSSPPPLGSPGPEDVARLDHYEQAKGPLPVALRAFYQHIGAVNFVGQMGTCEHWPADYDGFDPLQVHSFRCDRKPLLLFEDPNGKYFESNVDVITTGIPCPAFDAVLRFMGKNLEWEGAPMTLMRYIRVAVLEHAGVFPADPDHPPMPRPKDFTEGLPRF